MRLLLAAVVGLSLFSSTAQAAAILPGTTSPPPRVVDGETAIAMSSGGSTRWSRVTIEGSGRTLWLLPARPGAAVDVASDAWLDALDEATAARVVAPAGQSCTTNTAERVPSWHLAGTKRAPIAITSHSTEASLRELANARAFTIADGVAPSITALYARGWALVAVEIDASGGAAASPTVRISDDGVGVPPLSIEGSAMHETRMTLFAIGDTPVTLRSAAEVDTGGLRWGPDGSNYAHVRRGWLERSANAWLREASSRDVVFERLSASDGSESPSLASIYFGKTAPTRPDCAEASKVAAAQPGIVDTRCAPGAALRVAGGAACAPKEGSLDAAHFMCDGAFDDLALALGARIPSRTVVTRFAGRIARGAAFGDESFVASESLRSPALTAPTSTCSAGTTMSPAPSPPRITMPAESSRGRDDDEAYVESESCGSTTSGYYQDYEEEAAIEGCASGSAELLDDGAYETDDEEYEGEDDSENEDEEEYWEEEPSEDDSDDDDGDAEPASLRPKAKAAKPHAHDGSSSMHRRRRSSPVSRMALLLGALVLPFRRRSRTASTR